MSRLTISEGVTYNQSSLFVRVWDWFNDGRVVTPLSFCQFWRTVLFYSPVKFLLTKLGSLFSALKIVKTPSINTPPVVNTVAKHTGSGIFSAIKTVLKSIWKPLRPVIIKFIGGLEFIYEHFEQSRLRGYGIAILGVLFILFIVVVMVIDLVAITFVLKDYWKWCLIGLGSFAGFASYIYLMLKTGMFGFVFNIILSAKHGICPPVTITRS